MHTILIGDAREHLATIPDGTVQTCVTSPPYYGLRDYNVVGQIGLEATVDAYVAALVDVFREVRRVLREDGTCWINLGSTYASGIMESEEYVLRDDLSHEERAYVLAELAKHFEAESETVSRLRATDAPAEPDVPVVLSGRRGAASELPDKGV